METFEKYRGEFWSYGGVSHEVTLEKVGAASGCAEGELVFDGDDPLTIELKETEKHEPLQGCSATLKVVSESDRAYVHLYTEDVTGWMLTVRRGGKLWWRGLLDPEQYEEPFERKDGYTVQLTFSDTGPMERLRFDLPATGWVTLGEVVSGALEACGYGRDFTENDGYRTGGVKSEVMKRVKMRAANFYDEEGEAMTWREAVESVLQPLGLRLVQREGTFTVYDLTAVLTAPTSQVVEWMGDSATLGVDRVYSEVKVTFNPYGDTTVADGSVNDLVITGNRGDMTVKAPGFETGDGVDEVYRGFKVEWGKAVVPGIELGDKGEFYKIEPIYSGSGSEGVAELMRTTRNGDAQRVVCGEQLDLTNLRTLRGTPLPIQYAVTPLFGIKPVWIGEMGDRLLKISVMLLHDCRYNPFEGKNRKNEEGNYGRQLKHWNFVSVPMRLWVEAEDGSIYYYTNNKVADGGYYGRTPNKGDTIDSWGEMRAGWVKADKEPAWGTAWLMWYDWGDRKNKTGCDGWATNRPTIGIYTGDLPAWWQKRGDGEFVALPEGVKGMLHCEIGTGVKALNHKREGPSKHATVPYWTLFKDLKLEMVDHNGLGIEGNDIVYSCTINPRAKEPLELDTTSGTGKDALPTSRGLFYNADGSRMDKIDHFYWGGLARPEEHLMRIIASQYGSRLDVLTGTVRIVSGAVPSLWDQSEPGKRFMLGAEVQHLQQDVADCTLVEVR